MKIPRTSILKARAYARALAKEQGWSAAQAWQAAMSNIRHEYIIAKHRAIQYGFLS